MPEKKMTRFQSPCAKYVYDPEAGDFERNIPPGTPFENLPDDWCCPKCGAEKNTLKNWSSKGRGGAINNRAAASGFLRITCQTEA